MKIFKYETQEQKNQLVKEFIRSSRSREDFCKEKGISKSSLSFFRQVLQEVKSIALPL